MEYENANRRGFLKRLVAAVGGLTLIPAFAGTAQAGRSRFRGWGGYGYGYPRRSHRRFYGGFPGYGGYGYPGRGGFAPGIYNRGYNGGYYGGGMPYGGGFYRPVVPVVPYGGGYYPPILKLNKPRLVGDPLSLLEC